MIKAVIFDMDGVIVHGERFSDRFAREHGISLEATKSFFSNEFQDCLIGKRDLKAEVQTQIPKWGWRGSVDELLNFWFADKENAIDERFFPLIQKLRERGIKCYLGTNNEKYRTDYLSQQRNLKDSFDGVFSSAYLGCKKPEPEFFQKICGQIGDLRKQEILLVDDDPENVEAARNFGFATETYEDFAKLEDRLSGG